MASPPRTVRAAVVACCAAFFAALLWSSAASSAGSRAGSVGRPAAQPQTPAPLRINCHPSAATRTIAKSRTARLFAHPLQGDVYACLYSTGRAYYLSPSEHYDYQPVRFAGPYVAFAQFLEANLENVDVMDLRNGRLRVFAVSSSGASEVDSMVLKPDGAVAWIAANLDIVRPDGTYAASAIEVRRHDRRGPRVLDQGTSIAPGSLRLAGSVLRWTHAGHTMSASLS